jgi:hypothetical protein
MSDVHVAGTAEALAAIMGIERGLAPHGALDRAVEIAAQEEGAAEASRIVPYDTGALSRAQTVWREGETIIIGTSPDVVNPKSHTLPADYGPIVAATHFDFYGQVMAESSDAIVDRAWVEFVQAVRP